MHFILRRILIRFNRCSVMLNMLTSSGVDHEFKLRSGQIKDYKIVFCCFSTKHAVLKSKNQDWFVQNKDYVSKWSACCFSEIPL